MRILYTRTSTLGQSTERQKVNAKDFSLVIEDKCSGSIPFFEREGGKKVKSLVEGGSVVLLAVWQIDRLGRSLHDILSTVKFFTESGIPIEFISQGLRTMDADGRENPISKMIISILGVVAEMERSQIKERQKEGIQVAKSKGLYLGRKKGSEETVLSFLSKPKHKKVIEYLKRGYKGSEAAKLAGVHPNTVTKIKRLGLQVQ
jgi:DNA invertase Pin-like site-specific DNA recombinase